MRVSGLCHGGVDALQWGAPERAVDFFDVKGDVQAMLSPRKPEFRPAEHPAMHPGRCASVWLDDQCIGHVGELHPRWRQAYELPLAPVMFELELDAVLARVVPAYDPVGRHQAVERDLAIVVKESVTHAAVVEAIRAPASPWLRDVVLFDVYRPKKHAGAPSGAGTLAEDEKSLALRLVLNRDDATLTDEDIEATVKGALASVEQRLAGRLRA